jgi:ubiquinone/menaquinone biosynthesis C-methylase UbiE
VTGTARSDALFAGSIPELYDRLLVPLLFEPYAADLASRLAARPIARVLELAAGTGAVTRKLAAVLPSTVAIVATDLNQAMLDVAAGRIACASVQFRQADALALPFPDSGFDLVISQFGVMFFPDRIAAYREARRMLRPPHGRFLFNAWDRVENNPVTAAVGAAMEALFPDDPPRFYARIPFGYHDTARIEADLRAAGFTDIAIETVTRTSRVDARDAATGLCQGTPLRAEIEERGSLEAATEAAAAALASFNGADAPMSAHVVSAG